MATPSRPKGNPVRTIRSICVFCGSSPGEDESFSAAASALGKLLAERQITLIYGGAQVGLMGIVANACLAGGGEVHGVITRALQGKEIDHEGLTSLRVVDTMHDRKAAMAGQADGFIMLPGGLGTLEEFFEAATWTQLGIQSKPCGILNVAGYFDPLIELLDEATRQRFVREGHREMVIVESDPVAMLERMEIWEPIAVEKWLDRSDI